MGLAGVLRHLLWSMHRATCAAGVVTCRYQASRVQHCDSLAHTCLRAWGQEFSVRHSQGSDLTRLLEPGAGRNARGVILRTHPLAC